MFEDLIKDEIEEIKEAVDKHYKIRSDSDKNEIVDFLYKDDFHKQSKKDWGYTWKDYIYQYEIDIITDLLWKQLPGKIKEIVGKKIDGMDSGRQAEFMRHVLKKIENTTWDEVP